MLIPAIITACAHAVMLLVYSRTYNWYYSSLLTEKQSQVEAILAPNGNNLNNALHRRFSLISGMNAYIQSYLVSGKSLPPEEFDHFSRGLYAAMSGTRKILIAPRGIVAFEYPQNLSDSSLGLNLIKQVNPLTDNSIFRSITTKKTIIKTPEKLNQGGIIITANQAVFDENGLWGLISFEYDLIQIMSESNLTLAQSGLTWGLFDEENAFFFGDPTITEKDPIEYRIALPEGYWFLKAAPRKGWDQSIQQEFRVFLNVNFIIISLLTILVYVVVSQQTRLSRLVSLRTTALRDELNLRTTTEKRLQVNEEKFRSVFNQMSDLAFLYQLVASNLPGSILEVNDATCNLLGFSRTEILRLNLLDLELSKNRVRLFQRSNDVSLTEQGFFETELLKKNGETLPVEIRVKYFSMQDEKVGLIIARDITERKTAEKDLKRANRALKVLIEFNESLVREESETELLEVLCRILVNTGQYDLAWAGFIDENTQTLVTRVIEKSEKALHLSIPENKIISPLPTLTDNSISLPLTIKNEIVGALGIVLSDSSRFSDEEINLLNKLADDISYGVMMLRMRIEARRTTDQLRESEALYHGLARNIPNGVVMLFDKKLHHILADGLGLAEFGLTPEAVIGKPAKEIFPADICSLLNSQYEAALAGNSITQEFQINNFVYEMHCSPIRNNHGNVVMGLNLIQNITEHKILQQTIKHQQEEEQMILDSIPALIFFKTVDKKITWVNKTFQNNLGLPESYILNKFDYEIFSTPESNYLAVGDDELYATGQPQIDIIEQVPLLHGPRWFKTDKIPIINSDGGLDGLIGFSFDITDLKNAEQEISQLNLELENRVARRTAELEEKNNELEAFSYSVSHDLKAPLRGISGYSQLLMENYASSLDGEGMEFLFTIQESVKRMDQLISDLLSYSRMERRKLNNRQLDIRELFQSLLSEYRDVIRSRNIQIEEVYSFSTIFSDAEGLSQVFRNLIGNAVKFTREQSNPLIRIIAEETRDTWQISISDNGIGLDMTYQEKIFEIFQRLQNSDEFPGTGVGLAIVRKVVTRLGGTVRVESEKAKGATFIVEIMKGTNESE
ncbi:MAG: PAS domain S-box protein [Anaerolineaceae bacterium]